MSRPREPERQEYTDGVTEWAAMLRLLAATFDLTQVNGAKGLRRAVAAVTHPVELWFLRRVINELGLPSLDPNGPIDRRRVVAALHQELMADYDHQRRVVDERNELLARGIGVAHGLEVAGAPAATSDVVRRLVHQVDADAQLVKTVTARLSRRA